jgi:LuxR family maltose regulon positive regulatory protein
VLARLQELEKALSLLEASAQWSEVVALAPHVARAAAAERPWFAARAEAARAVALDASGRRAEADASCVEALRLGERGGFVRAYIAGHPRRGELLARAARRRGPARAEATRVLEAAPELGRRRSRNPLTPTQVEILRKVAEGHSNKAVARAQGVSLSTVKTHLRAAFARLEARSRTQAVARAREQALL